MVVGISGSFRRESFSAKLLKAFAERAPEGYELKVVDISQLPMYNDDLLDNPPPAVAEFKESVKPAAGVLFVTPEYNRSFTPVIKNAIDWGSRPPADNVWNGKPAAIAGVSPHRLGAVGAVLHLRQVLVFPNLIPLQQPEFYLSLAEKRFDAAGKLVDAETEQHIKDFWTAFTTHIERHAG